VAAAMPSEAVDIDDDIGWDVTTDEGDFDGWVQAACEEDAIRKAIDSLGSEPGCTVDRSPPNEDRCDDDSDGTPDTLPAVDACAALTS
jgi:hypothetical protein